MRFTPAKLGIRHVPKVVWPMLIPLAYLEKLNACARISRSSNRLPRVSNRTATPLTSQQLRRLPGQLVSQLVLPSRLVPLPLLPLPLHRLRRLPKPLRLRANPTVLIRLWSTLLAVRRLWALPFLHSRTPFHRYIFFVFTDVSACVGVHCFIRISTSYLFRAWTTPPERRTEQTSTGVALDVLCRFAQID